MRGDTIVQSPVGTPDASVRAETADLPARKKNDRWRPHHDAALETRLLSSIGELNPAPGTMNIEPIRLSALSHSGGCGRTLAPSVLSQLFADRATTPHLSQLLVGDVTSADAAVRQIDDHTCVIASTGFVAPMVDDPRDFGRIAAAHALSNIYAKGGKPIMALTILGMPTSKLPVDTARKILEGGASICLEAEVPIASTQAIELSDLIYGMSVVGVCTPANVRCNSGARPGDALILTKGIGIGIYSAAFKKGALPPGAYDEMIASTTLLNRIGAVLAEGKDIHAITELTDFGLLGHGLEMARGSGVALNFRFYRIPLLEHAANLAEKGFTADASNQNWDGYGKDVTLPTDLPAWQLNLLTDPQTSGGLLIACAQDRATKIRESIVAAGYPRTQIIGSASAGAPAIRIS